MAKQLIETENFGFLNPHQYSVKEDLLGYIGVFTAFLLALASAFVTFNGNVCRDSRM